MQKTRKNRGFTLAETLIVVAIIIILMAVAFLMLNRRSATKKQYDEHAKEIFIAAQNHLSMADNLSYLGRPIEAFGTLYESNETPEDPNAPPVTGIYYFTSADLSTEGSVLDLILPFGSIDESVRKGGKFIIQYHKDSGQVLNVFYWQENGLYPYSGTPDLATLLGDVSRNALMFFGTGAKKAVIGYWGGVEATEVQLVRPDIWVENGARLTVYVRENNEEAIVNNQNYTLRLNVQGEHGGSADVEFVGFAGNVYTFILDDVTDATTTQFSDATLSDYRFSTVTGGRIAPGDNLTIRAYGSLYSNTVYSDAVSANSLFDNATAAPDGGTAGSAEISNIRHLENLCAGLSDVTIGDSGFKTAEQTEDLDLESFFEELAAANTSGSTPSYKVIGTGNPSTFRPVTPEGALDYDGGRHSISNITVQGAIDAGLFGELTGGSVSNLKLVDAKITGSTSAGALAGSVKNPDTGVITIQNVLAVGTEAEGSAVSAKSAGGLIGKTSGSCEIKKCAAAVQVQLVSDTDGNGSAGGLIGSVTGSPKIQGCYSAGTTENGRYSDANYNVTGGSAGTLGGLIGTADSATIEYCYSTCSVSGATVGGLVGTASGSISKCYATGLVNGTAAGAFAGSADLSKISNCWYYEIINVDVTTGVYTYLAPIPGVDDAGAAIVALDGEDDDHTAAESYDSFVGPQSGWTNATAYDGALNMYFTGKFPLKSVARLYGDTSPVTATDFVLTHYGDWPAPEIVVLHSPG